MYRKRPRLPGIRTVVHRSSRIGEDEAEASAYILRTLMNHTRVNGMFDVQGKHYEHNTD